MPRIYTDSDSARIDGFAVVASDSNDVQYGQLVDTFQLREEQDMIAEGCPNA